MIYSKKETDRILKEGNGRVVVENISPEVDRGRFSIKRVVNDTVKISADLFTDGHYLKCTWKAARPIIALVAYIPKSSDTAPHEPIFVGEIIVEFEPIKTLLQFF